MLRRIPTTEAQQTIYDFVNSQKRNSLRVTIKAILDRFNKKNYGWSNLAVLSNIAGLIGTNKIQLTYDSNLLSEDEFINYLKNSNFKSNIIVQIKEEIPKEKEEKLKSFYKNFFEKPPTAIETFEQRRIRQIVLKSQITKLYERLKISIHIKKNLI